MIKAKTNRKKNLKGEREKGYEEGGKEEEEEKTLNSGEKKKYWKN